MSRRSAWALVALLLVSCGDDSKSPAADQRLVADRGAGSETRGRDAATERPIDQAGPRDQGQPREAAAGGCSSGFAGCSTFSDGTAISFASFSYTPKCLRVKVGQAVSFSGSFSAHPLEQACGPAPVITATASGSSASFSFSKPGLYGYYCTLHGAASGTGMAGAIEVVP